MKMYEEHEMCREVDSGSLYKIGMFAAMNRVTVKALRFYEEQGLLLPSYIVNFLLFCTLKVSLCAFCINRGEPVKKFL